MKLRKHKGNRNYKIIWWTRTAPRTIKETHVDRDGKSRKVVTNIEPTEVRQPSVYTTGQNPTAVLKAFLFGRDRTNIIAKIIEPCEEFRNGMVPVLKTSYLGVISDDFGGAN